MPQKFTAYMDGIDFQDERGQPVLGNSLYAKAEQVLKRRKCSHECGVVEVEISLVKWVREQNLGTGHTREEIEAAQTGRRAQLEGEIVDIVEEIQTSSHTEGIEKLADWLTDRKRRAARG